MFENLPHLHGDRRLIWLARIAADAVRRFPRRGGAFAAAAALLLLTACATPVGVERLSATEVHRQLSSNVLSTGELSDFTENALRKRALDPEVQGAARALAELHRAVVAEPSNPEEIFALAELSFQYAEQAGGAPHYLAAGVYAYAYLFPGSRREPVSPFDPRFRWAADIYNLAVARAFRSADGVDFTPAAGTRALPFGTLDVSFDEAELVFHGRRFSKLTPVAEVSVRGLRNRYRQAGIGAPLAATAVPLNPEVGFQIGAHVRSSVTALLRLEDVDALIVEGSGRARIELHVAAKELDASLDGHRVPLEIEPTATLAYSLGVSDIWDLELYGFLRGSMLRDRPTRLGSLQPYVPGRIPVVFVHGTASSAGRWAEMVNDLTSDPRIRERFQFWFFQYETGNPILYSALVLRDALRDAIAKIDPEGKDPALRQMVVIGHSQGGLLTKLTAVDTGNRIVSVLTDRPLEELELSEATRDLLRRSLIVEPVPFVRRLVFIATPHGGSHVAAGTLPQFIAGMLRLPFTLAGAALEMSRSPDAFKLAPERRRFGSVYGMTPGSPIMSALSATPLAPGVVAHSIIAVAGDGPLEGGDDGVVAYKSAHIDDVASELVVRSGHSCQADPHAIAEVRRILLLHAGEAPPPAAVAAAAAPMLDRTTDALPELRSASTTK